MELNAKNAAAMKPGDKPLKDPNIPGLELYIGSTGFKRYYLRYCTKTGSHRRPKLGDYDVISLEQARAKAKEIRALVQLGGDPQKERQKARREDTLKAFAEQYFRDVRQSTMMERRRMWLKDCEHTIGRARLSEVTHSDVVALHAKLTKRGKRLADMVLQITNAIYNYAIRLRVLPRDGNPVFGLQWHGARSRKRYATQDELPKIGEFLRKHAEDDPVGTAFLWAMLFSGARPTELIRRRKDDLEVLPGGVGRLRIDQDKNGDERFVMLPPQAVEAIQAIPAPREGLVRRDPERAGRLFGPVQPPRKLWTKLLKETGIKGLWIRDLRRSWATTAMAAGHAVGHIGGVLGHNQADTTLIYAKLMDEVAVETVLSTAKKLDQLMSVTPDRPRTEPQPSSAT